MIEVEDNGIIRIINWHKRQPSNSYDRVVKHRQRKKVINETGETSGVTFCNTDEIRVDKIREEEIREDHVLTSIPDEKLSTEKGTDSDSDESVPPIKKNGVPYSEIMNAYNSICSPPLSEAQKLTEKRKHSIKILFRELKGMEAVRSYFERVMKSDWLTGKVKDWIADFEWLINWNNAVKVMEGRYDTRASPVKTVHSMLKKMYDELPEDEK